MKSWLSEQRTELNRVATLLLLDRDCKPYHVNGQPLSGFHVGRPLDMVNVSERIRQILICVRFQLDARLRGLKMTSLRAFICLLTAPTVAAKSMVDNSQSE